MGSEAMTMAMVARIEELEAEVSRLREERDAARAAIRWALGENGEFRTRRANENGAWTEGPYYWRRELQERARTALGKETP